MYRTNLTCVNFYFIWAHLDIYRWICGYAVRRVCSNPTIEKILSTFARMNERTMCLHKCRPKHIKYPTQICTHTHKHVQHSNTINEKFQREIFCWLIAFIGVLRIHVTTCSTNTPPSPPPPPPPSYSFVCWICWTLLCMGCQKEQNGRRGKQLCMYALSPIVYYFIGIMFCAIGAVFHFQRNNSNGTNRSILKVVYYYLRFVMPHFSKCYLFCYEVTLRCACDVRYRTA